MQLCTARSAVLNAGDYKKKLDRATGELLVAEKTKVDMDKNSLTYDRPQVVCQYSTEQQGGRC